MIGVDNDDREDQAHQQGTDHAVEEAGLATVEPDHFDAHDSVTHTVTKEAHEQHLLDRENGENSVGIAIEKCVGNQIGQGPVDANGKDTPPCSGHGSCAGFGLPQTLAGKFGYIRSVRPAEPRTYVFTIYHSSSLPPPGRTRASGLTRRVCNMPETFLTLLSNGAVLRL